MIIYYYSREASYKVHCHFIMFIYKCMWSKWKASWYPSFPQITGLVWLNIRELCQTVSNVEEQCQTDTACVEHAKWGGVRHRHSNMNMVEQELHLVEQSWKVSNCVHQCQVKLDFFGCSTTSDTFIQQSNKQNLCRTWSNRAKWCAVRRTRTTFGRTVSGRTNTILVWCLTVFDQTSPDWWHRNWHSTVCDHKSLCWP